MRMFWCWPISKWCKNLKVLKFTPKSLCLRTTFLLVKPNFFSCSAEAKDYLDNCEYPIVLKADGLAAGKGVLVAQDSDSDKKLGRCSNA